MNANGNNYSIKYGQRTVNIFNDKVTKDKIYRHLVDINDKITEDDIRNIKVSIPSNNTALDISKQKSKSVSL